jgi:hypothetical protein
MVYLQIVLRWGGVAWPPRRTARPVSHILSKDVLNTFQTLLGYPRSIRHHRSLEDTAMDNDDRQVGRILSRREALALFGAAGAALIVARASEALGSPQAAAPAQAATAHNPRATSR